MKIQEIDLTAWDMVLFGALGLFLLFCIFGAGQSFRANRAYCEAACYPVDPIACEYDFAVCWSEDRIRKIRRRH